MLIIRKALIAALIGILVCPPMGLPLTSLAMAQGVTPDASAPQNNRPNMDTAPNGVPVVNIATPSGSGLSHNKFTDYNVSNQGLILNNSKQSGANSQLGGPLMGNPNLQKSGEAKAILNEVTSTNRSRIEGYTEVHGGRAAVILANPNGITVDGGGYINVSRATLTTGHPQVDNAGRLQSLEVKGGTVNIEGKGINAANIDGFDIITQATEINAEVHAKDLNIIAGRNSYNHQTGQITPLEDQGGLKPSVSIDSSELGGMYAGRIKLVSSEKGVGVNLDGIVQSTSSLAITADGKLIAKDLTSGGNISVNAQDIEKIENCNAAGNIKLHAQDENRLTGKINTASAVEISGGKVRVDEAEIAANTKASFISDDLQIKNSKITAANTIETDGRLQQIETSTLTAGENMIFSGGVIDIKAQSVLLSLKDAHVISNEFNLADSQFNVFGQLVLNGKKYSQSNSSLYAAHLNTGLLDEFSLLNSSRFVIDDNISLAAKTISNNASLLFSNLNINLLGNNIRNTEKADILSGGDILIQGLNADSMADMLLNEGAYIESLDGDISIYAKEIKNIGTGSVTTTASSHYFESKTTLHTAGGEMLTDGKIPEYLQSLFTAYGVPIEHPDFGAAKKTYISTFGYLPTHVRTSYYIKDYLTIYNDKISGELDSSKILASKNLNLFADTVLNDKGIMSASDNINIKAKRLNNIGLELSKRISVLREYHKDKHYVDQQGQGPGRTDRGVAKYTYNLSEVTSVVPAIIAAGGQVVANISEGVDNNAFKHGEDYVGRSLSLPSMPTGESIKITSNPLDSIRIGGLYNYASPDHNYLISSGITGNFFGSDYFFSRIGLNSSNINNKNTKLLGDAFLETRLVREQVLTQTGKRFLFPNISSDAEMMQLLLNNAVAEGHALDLTIGVSLSPQQVASLSSDIVWLVEQEVMGQKVLVPTLYVCDATRLGTDIPRGATISGSDVLIASKSIKNSGAIKADNLTALISEHDVVNRGGDISGTKVYIEAENNILNQSGTIIGGDIHLQAGNDVRMETVTEKQAWQKGISRQSLDSTYADRVYMGETAVLSGSGNVSVNAGGDVVFKAANVNAGETLGVQSTGSILVSEAATGIQNYLKTSLVPTLYETKNHGSNIEASTILFDSGKDIINRGGSISGNNISLNSAENIIMTSLLDHEGRTYNDYRGREQWKNHSETKLGAVAQVTAKNDLALNADKNIKLTASEITAGNNVALSAGESINLDFLREQKVDPALSSRHGDNHNSAQNVVGSSISGINTSLTANKDITGTAATISAKENTLISAGQDISFSAASETDVNINTKLGGKSKFGNVYRSTPTIHKTTVSVTQVSSDISGQNVAIQSGNNFSLDGSNLTADKQASIRAGNDITVTSATESTKLTSSANKNNFTYQSSEKGSDINAAELEMFAGNDITVSASQLQTTGDAKLIAGNNLSIISALNEFHSFSKWKGGNEEKQDFSVVGSNVSAQGNLQLTAGADASKGQGNITVFGSNISAADDLSMSASGNVALSSAESSGFYHYENKRKGLTSSKSTIINSTYITQVASNVIGENVNIQAGDNVLVTASNITANKDINLSADKGDVMLTAAQDSSTYFSETKKKKFGVFLTPTSLNFAEGEQTKNLNYQENNIASMLMSGNDINIDAGRDIGFIGSGAVAENDINLLAKRDVNLTPGREVYNSRSETKKSSVGLSWNFSESGVGFFAGYKGKEEGIDQKGNYVAGSVLGAGNDVIISAGRDVNQISSHIEAVRDVNVTAGQDWNMLAAQNIENLHQWVKTIEAGIGAEVRQNVTGAARTVIEMPKNAAAGKGGPGYTAATAISEGLRTIDAVSSALNETVSASVKLGASTSKTDYKAHSETAVPSSVNAGRDITGTAERDITIEGGKVLALRDITLDAGRDVNIVAAQSTGGSKFSSSSSSAGVGAKAAVGSGGLALGVMVEGSASGAKSNSDYLNHNNAIVAAGDTLSITSGHDTNVAGAHLSGDRVWLDVGNDLNVVTVQDTSHSKSSSWNVGGSVTAGIGVHVGVNIGFGKGSSNSQWANDQTSIIGTSEVDIYTGKNTDIKGAVIAAKNGNLLLDTETLTYSELHDKDQGKYTGVNVSAGVGFGDTQYFDSIPTGLGGKLAMITPMDFTGSNSPGSYLPNTLEINYSSHDKEAVSRPTVGEGTIIVRSDPDAGLEGLNRDIEKAREVTKDEEKYLNVYISPAAIAEAIDGFKGIEKNLDGLSDTLQSIVDNYKAATATLPPEHQHLGQAGLDSIKLMLANGVSEDVVEKIISDPKYQELLSTGSALTQKYDSGNWSTIKTQISGSTPIYDPVTGKTNPSVHIDMNDEQRMLEFLGDANQYIKSIPYEAERNAALLGLQLAMGGPLKVGAGLITGVIAEFTLGDIKESALNELTARVLHNMDYDTYYKLTEKIHEIDSDANDRLSFAWYKGGIDFSIEVIAGLGMASTVKGAITKPSAKNRTPIAEPGHAYKSSPKDNILPAFPSAVKTKPHNGRDTWEDKKFYYQWDSKKGAVEKYRKSDGKHLGEFNITTGKPSGPAKADRKFKP